MRNTILIGSFLMTLLCIISCTDDSPKATVKNGVTANELSSLSASDYVLLQAEEANVFNTFTWTAPDFGFASSITYTLQLDLAGNNFANATTLVTVNKLLTASLTVTELNKKLLDMGLTAGEKTAVEVRVMSMVNDNVTPVYSNVKSFTVTPYATVFPPLYIVGDAQSWNLANATKLKNTGAGEYESVAQFVNNGKFRFFATPSWDAQQWNWTFFEGGSVDALLESGGDGDGNFLFNGTSGTYKVTVSTKDKTIVLEAVEQPALYMIGDALQGWDLSKAVELTWLGGGLFETTTTFSNNIFRFFGKPDWTAGYGNYTYFASGKIDAVFEDKGDGDHNFNFIGTAGAYKITVDTDDLTIVMTPQ